MPKVNDEINRPEKVQPFFRISSFNPRNDYRNVKTKWNFTLIELLIAIAIIAILAGILLPALGKVKGYTKKISCLNTSRSLGMFWSFYADASDGYLVPATSSSELIDWSVFMAESSLCNLPCYSSHRVMNIEEAYRKYSPYLCCPTSLSECQKLKQYKYNLYIYAPTPATYAYNSNFNPLRNLCGISISATGVIQKYNQITANPSKVAVFADSPWRYYDYEPWDNFQVFMVPGYTYRFWGGYSIHSGYCNFLFADLHASSAKSPEEITLNPKK
ncbi:MAG: hypothetical protein A4E71_00014 [Smithella sp. PtaU1.Bin162]|nr:MAG: hypothetical protein A4E71_00014 [Smithella sp. PtaU1.Bin162]